MDRYLAEYAEIHPGSSAAEAEKRLDAMKALLTESQSIRGWLVRFRKFSSRFECQRVPTPAQLERLIELSNEAQRRQMRDRLYDLDGLAFERVIVSILGEQPWVDQIEQTVQTGDAGIDFVLRYGAGPFDGAVALGQVKRTKGKVGTEEMRTFIGSITTHPEAVSRGIYVAFGGFNEEAQRLADRNTPQIQTVDIEEVLDWLVDAELGVTTLETPALRLESAFWDELQ